MTEKLEKFRLAIKKGGKKNFFLLPPVRVLIREPHSRTAS